MVRALINTEATVGGVTMISRGGAYGYTGALVEMQSVDDAAAACDRLNGVAVPVNVSQSTFTHWELRGGRTDPHRDPQLLRSGLSAFVAGAPESRAQGKAHSL